MLWWTLRKLNSEDRDVRRRAIEKLSTYSSLKLGTYSSLKIVKPLVMALNDGEGWVRRLAEKVLVQIGKEAVVLLIKMLEDGDTRQRTDVARVLGTIGDVRAVEPLIMALSSGERQVRNEAANALGAIGDVRAVESLVCALLNRDAELRRRAANALEKIGWEPRDNRECALRAVALRRQGSTHR